MYYPCSKPLEHNRGLETVAALHIFLNWILIFEIQNILLLLLLIKDDPLKRPTIGQVLNDDFITTGYMPSRLPTSCLTMAPRFDTKMAQISSSQRRGPLQEINKEISAQAPGSAIKKSGSVQSAEITSQCESLLQELHKQLASVIATNPASKAPCSEDELEDPKASPMIWVSKWVDYSDKYGFGYALCDESIGVVFNDLTKLLLLSDGRWVLMNFIHFLILKNLIN